MGAGGNHEAQGGHVVKVELAVLRRQCPGPFRRLMGTGAGVPWAIQAAGRGATQEGPQSAHPLLPFLLKHVNQ